ncbi:alpha/beta hydrolase [Niastella caeni]|uniref:Alpha/beta hydrolase n=1 Tax=Niastella caeni TaxID=2569763 RepID=A0A4V4GYZ4_9BACT|nr:alpha/beta hydrolase [Niastella caeni]THU30746.1 alpha/beta hydrolase [Niastella caeni]
MKRNIILVITVLFTTCCVNAFAQTNTYPFAVKKSGQGKQTIIFIPGFASSDDVWAETKTKFEKDFTCISFTMAGFAGVPAQPEQTFVKWETSIAKYVRDNKIEKPVIIGHSMGGVLALAIAADFPDLPGKIIVVDALPCRSAAMDPAFKSKENNDCSAMVNQMAAMSNEQFKQMQIVNIASLCSDKEKQSLIVNWGLQTDRKTFAEMFCDFSNTDLREKISNIKCSSLILLESYFASMKPMIEEQYKNLKAGNLQYANKGLHFIMYDDKEWYFDQLNKFIAQ